MAHISLLAPVLIRLSLSADEILLPWPQASDAVGVLAGSDVAVVAWEGWLRNVDGKSMPSLEHIGIQPLQRERTEAWPVFVARCAQWVVMTMQMEHQRYVTTARSEYDDIFFCLVTRNGE